MKNTKRHVPGFLILLALIGLTIAAPVFADTNQKDNEGQKPPVWSEGKGPAGIRPGIGMMKPVIVGRVEAISGNTLTITAQQGIGLGMGRNRNATSSVSATTKTYTVDAANATILKNNATSSVSSIAVGDVLIVQGTLNETSITATLIRDGMMRGQEQDKNESNKQALSVLQGNGQPIIGGKVSAISGATLTVTNTSNVTYTVDASNAKILQGQTTSSLASLKVGDAVTVQGTVNGTSVIASTVIDQTKPEGQKMNFFAGIGQFFRHLFGF